MFVQISRNYCMSLLLPPQSVYSSLFLFMSVSLLLLYLQNRLSHLALSYSIELFSICAFISVLFRPPSHFPLSTNTLSPADIFRSFPFDAHI
jgi:hypothetical protein